MEDSILFVERKLVFKKFKNGSISNVIYLNNPQQQCDISPISMFL